MVGVCCIVHPMTTQNLLDSHQAAEHLNIGVQTLRLWRHKSRGPKYYRIGTHIRYRATDLDEWQSNRTVCVDPEASNG
jgi:excisionase family DNA binding protein